MHQVLQGSGASLDSQELKATMIMGPQGLLAFLDPWGFQDLKECLAPLAKKEQQVKSPSHRPVCIDSCSLRSIFVQVSDKDFCNIHH